MEVPYSPTPTSKKAQLPSSRITKKNTVHIHLRVCQRLHFQNQHLVLIVVSSHSLLVQMVSLFHKFSCCSLHFGVRHLMLDVPSHQLLVLIVHPLPKSLIKYTGLGMRCQLHKSWKRRLRWAMKSLPKGKAARVNVACANF